MRNSDSRECKHIGNYWCVYNETSEKVVKNVFGIIQQSDGQAASSDGSLRTYALAILLAVFLGYRRNTTFWGFADYASVVRMCVI